MLSRPGNAPVTAATASTAEAAVRLDGVTKRFGPSIALDQAWLKIGRGEFMTLPIQKDTSRYATSAKIVECLADGDAGATALGYVAPTAEGAAAQASANTAGANDFWVKAVGDAKPRTADNLGIKYPVISEQLYTAIQLALSGGASPTDALTAAQAAAAPARGGTCPGPGGG